MSDSEALSVCFRILNDMVNELAARYGVEPVALALTEIVGCELCVNEAARGANLHELVKKLVNPPRRSD